MTLKEVYEQSKTSAKSISSLITKGKQSSLIAIGLGEGVILNEHKAPGPTKIIVVKGTLEYSADGRKTILAALEEFDIPLGEVHSVKGIEHVVFLLSVNK